MNLPDWLGKIPDAEVARRYGIPRTTVQGMRYRAGIAACYPRGKSAALLAVVNAAGRELTAAEAITLALPDATGADRRHARRCLSYLASTGAIRRVGDGRYRAVDR